MAKLFLSSTDTSFTVADSNWNIYGASGSQTVLLNSGVTNIVINATVEAVQLSGALSSYKFKQTGNRLSIYAIDGTTLISKIGLQNDSNGTQLIFSNGTFDAKYLAGNGTLNLTIDGQTVNNITPTALNSAPTLAIPSTAILNPTTGHSYLLSTSSTWQGTENQAVALGGHLVTINDAAENAWLVSTFGSSEILWVGLNDRNTEGVFVWASGETAVYRNWFAGPDDYNSGTPGQDYVLFNWINAGQWQDDDNNAGKTDSANTHRGIIEIAGSNTIIFTEDTVKTFAVSDFGSDADGNLASVIITSLPAAGTLKRNGAVVAVNDVITVSDLNGSLLTYTPPQNANGVNYAQIGYTLKDSANATASGRLSLSLTSINDAPSLSPNLLINGDAELGNLTGWTVVNGGDPWVALGSSHWEWADQHSGNYGFLASYSAGSLTQEVDLLAKGYSATYLDLAPTLDFGAYVKGCDNMGSFGDTYRIKASLLNASGAVIGIPFDSGVLTATGTWTQKTSSFSNYGAGARYIKLELLSVSDAGGWAGNYGVRFDDAFVYAQAVTPTFTENGSPVAVNASVVLSDPDFDAIGNYNGMKVTLSRYDDNATDGMTPSQDIFSATGNLSFSGASGNFVLNGTTIGTFTQANGILSIAFTNATKTQMNEALRSIVYETTSDAPNSTVIFNWVIDDDNVPETVMVITSDMNITAVNDAPSLAITGSAETGQVLTADLVDVDGLPAAGLITYEWQANGVAISGATNSTYTLTPTEEGKAIRVSASYTDLGYTLEAITSAATSKVTVPNTQPTFNGSLDNTPVFQGSSPVVLDSTAEIVDAELNALNNGFGDFAGSTLTLQRQGSANANDFFDLDSGSFYYLDTYDNTIKDYDGSWYSYGTYSNNNGIFTINFNNHSYDETSRINAILSSITYSNYAISTNGTVPIEWKFQDGSGGEVTQTMNVTVSLPPPPPIPTVNSLSTADTTPTITGTIGSTSLNGDLFSVSVNGVNYWYLTDFELSVNGDAWTLNVPASAGLIADTTYDVMATRNGVDDQSVSELTILPPVTPTQLGATTYGASTHYYLYYQNQTAVTFDDALTLAANFAAANNITGYTSHLATITSLDEQSISGTVLGNVSSHAWLGGTVANYENDSTWTATNENTQFVNYFDFNTSEPNFGDYGIALGYDQGVNYWYGEDSGVTLVGMIIEFEPI